ncbi:MAG: enoyl-CoA hydratase/isomerase family protein, partial [Deltaproteobacteria bacterium]|nr:enoyl-CoA hydratase/isomerase family protein [Deltaproteobacteria bacterium]
MRVVTIDRPNALNAIDVATMGELASAFESCAAAAEATPRLRAVIVTGAGDKAFAAGADIAALATLSADEARAFS